MTSLFCIFAFVASYPQQCDADWILTGYDEFDSTSLDKTKWDFEIGNGCNNGMCGWGNQELETYTDSPQNARVEDGKLILTAIKDNNTFTSARLVSRGKSDWQFGKFEFKVQVPSGQGLWPAIWMLSSKNKFGNWPRSGEIDIIEILGQNTSVAHCTEHLGNAWNDKYSNSIAYSSGADFSKDFHIFEIIWELDKIEWFIDGVSVKVLKSSDVPSKYIYPFNEEFYLIINLAVGGQWPKAPDNQTVFPAEFKIDYVRVFKNN